jgi:hypothetical protein
VSISGAVLSNTGAEVTCIERERERRCTKGTKFEGCTIDLRVKVMIASGAELA